MISYGLYHPD